MPKFIVTIEETRFFEVEVVAANAVEAFALADKMPLPDEPTRTGYDATCRRLGENETA